MDGVFGIVGGSEFVYNLSDYFGIMYIGDVDVMFIIGLMGFGD